MTAPREDGQGPRLAMRNALRHAAIKPGAVDYVNAHATSTPLGDAAENRAIKELLLGEHGKDKASEINVSSTKGAIGHLLGAAGSVEAIFTILGMHNVSKACIVRCVSALTDPRTLCRLHSTLRIQATQRKTSIAITLRMPLSRKGSMSHYLTASVLVAPTLRSAFASSEADNFRHATQYHSSCSLLLDKRRVAISSV
jgi:hypothetical protein